MSKRKIKISRSFFNDNRKVPLIRLQGIWLEDLGFKPGEYIEVKEDAGHIVLKLLEGQGQVSQD